ncbi:zinc-ribbon domain-containing protein [Octadecabacter sp. CECT 8868]|nr:zinc-ribbon domain-containing protein [Octadecabacter algicola]MCF2904751.1 zinc-ribbon domain-containing protein [Octadecabacter algicola]
MRLICPNCGAQYEVGDDVISEAGRDVQCSNCGHAWFETPGASEKAELAAEATPPEPVQEPESDIIQEPVPEPEPEVIPEPEPAPEPKLEQEQEQISEPEPEQAPEPELRQREIDPGVADILREEADYEQAARQAEADPIETQPDLDLSQDPDEDRRSREARDRLARLRGETDVASTTAAIGATMAHDAETPRSELLPDIDEINSTLRHDGSGHVVAADAAEEELKQRSGFRRGFIFVIVLALLALAAYIFAPQIIAALPQTETAMTSYVEWVDGLRLWLDGKVQGLVEGASDAPAEAVEPVTTTDG